MFELSLPSIPPKYENQSIFEIHENALLGMSFENSIPLINQLINKSKVIPIVKTKFIDELQILLIETSNVPSIQSSILDCLYPPYQENEYLLERQKLIVQLPESLDVQEFCKAVQINVIVLEIKNESFKKKEIYTSRRKKFICIVQKNNQFFASGILNHGNIQTIFNFGADAKLENDFKTLKLSDFIYKYFYS